MAFFTYFDVGAEGVGGDGPGCFVDDPWEVNCWKTIICNSVGSRGKRGNVVAGDGGVIKLLRSSAKNDEARLRVVIERVLPIIW